MNLWRAVFTDAERGLTYSWHTSKRGAARTLAELRRASESQGVEGVERVAVPTKRSELVDWLNANLHFDNG